MAIYHFHVNSGDAGRAAEHSDYIARRGKSAHEHEGERVETFGGNLPGWADSSRAFWSAADQHERKNGSPYREFEGALPRELTDEQNRALLRDFIEQELGGRHVYECAIHFKPGNPHFHLQFSERELDGIARPPEQFFKRYNQKEPTKSGCKKSIRFAGGELSDRKQQRQNLRDVRRAWAVTVNRHLEMYGHVDRIDHRSFADRGITAVPGKHMGAFATALELVGVRSKRGDLLDEYRKNQGRARRPAENCDPADRPGRAMQTPTPTTPAGAEAGRAPTDGSIDLRHRDIRGVHPVDGGAGQLTVIVLRRGEASVRQRHIEERRIFYRDAWRGDVGLKGFGLFALPSLMARRILKNYFVEKTNERQQAERIQRRHKVIEQLACTSKGNDAIKLFARAWAAERDPARKDIAGTLAVLDKFGARTAQSRLFVLSPSLISLKPGEDRKKYVSKVMEEAEALQSRHQHELEN